MISSIHSFLLRIAKTFGLNKLGFLKKLYFRFGNTPIPFFIKIQGIWMSHVLIRMYLKGAHEPGLTKVSHRILKPGMTAIDCGALYGYHTFIFAKLVGQTGRVYSFEPIAENWRYIEYNGPSNLDRYIRWKMVV